jgi:hypothetical protein
MATTQSAGRPLSEARPERIVSDRISLPGAAAIGGARDSGGSAPGSAMIRPGSALGWATVAPRSALGWTLGRAPTPALGDKQEVESRVVPDELAPGLEVRFLSAFPCAPVSASLAPLVGGLVPVRLALGCGEALALLTRWYECRI